MRDTVKDGECYSLGEILEKVEKGIAKHSKTAAKIIIGAEVILLLLTLAFLYYKEVVLK